MKLQLYQKYKIEDEVLNDVRKEMEKIDSSLKELEREDRDWVKAFRDLFNHAIEKKEWEEKVPILED